MAKQKTYKYPSIYGSHRSMVVETFDNGDVVCEDEFGTYTTSSNRLDSGLADPNRCVGSRLEKLYKKN